MHTPLHLYVGLLGGSVAAPVPLARQVIDDRRVHAVRHECRAGVIEVDEFLTARGFASQTRNVECHAAADTDSGRAGHLRSAGVTSAARPGSNLTLLSTRKNTPEDQEST